MRREIVGASPGAKSENQPGKSRFHAPIFGLQPAWLSHFATGFIVQRLGRTEQENHSKLSMFTRSPAKVTTNETTIVGASVGASLAHGIVPQPVIRGFDSLHPLHLSPRQIWRFHWGNGRRQACAGTTNRPHRHTFLAQISHGVSA